MDVPGVDEAVALLRRAARAAGFVASPADGHYAAVWSRDAAVACLGAHASGEPDLVAAAGASLRTMAAHAPGGRVADVVWPEQGYADWGEAGALDATAWFVVALEHHHRATGDDELAEALWPTARAAVRRLAACDLTGWGTIDTPPAADWMDSSLNRAGKVFHVNVLYAWATRAAARLAALVGDRPPIDDDAVAEAVEALFWPEPGTDLADLVEGAPAGSRFPHSLAAGAYRRAARSDRRHHLASVSYGRFLDRCDVLAECLAIVSGLVSGERAATVLACLADAGVDRPWPSRTWPEPFRPDDLESLLDPVADAAQDPRWRNPPGAYHNGAVWPLVGAFHAAAAAAAGREVEAADRLGRVAAANRLGAGFPEWIHAATGEPMGRDQTWNAGAFLWAAGLLQGGTGGQA